MRVGRKKGDDSHPGLGRFTNLDVRVDEQVHHLTRRETKQEHSSKSDPF